MSKSVLNDLGKGLFGCGCLLMLLPVMLLLLGALVLILTAAVKS